MSTALTPTAHRVHLGVLLRNHRDQTGLETKEVAKALGWYDAKVSRVETGMRTVVPAELDRLLELYEVEPEEAESLRQLGAQARKRGPIGPLPQRAHTFVAIESIADELAYYSEEVIPHPAQTEDYARAQILGSSPDRSPAEVELLVAIRAQRGQRLHGSRNPTPATEGVTIDSRVAQGRLVLSEAALRRPVGGVDAFRVQLRYLLDLAELPNVSVQILPAEAGAHAALGLSFQMARLLTAQADFVYLDGLADGTYLSESTDTRPYVQAFDKVGSQALSRRKSAKMIERYLADL
jgi:transcriptional regulator with XRE-family HTH domain